MDHVLNDQYYNGQYNNNKGTGNPYDDDFVKQHSLSVPFDQATPLHLTAHPSPARSPLGSPYNNQQAHLGSPKNNHDSDYVIEGTIHNKGCVCQTADDGFLFGCGTHPHDEVVYVYYQCDGEEGSAGGGGG